MTTVRLSNEIEKQISALIKLENISKSEIIKKAITEYYEKHSQNLSPYELGKDLFGRNGSDENLSTTYKSKLKGILNEKHSH